MSPFTTTTAPAAAHEFAPTDAQHADLLEQYLRQDLSICGLAARFERSPADIARWANSPRTLADLAEIHRAMQTRSHFHTIASRTAAEQFLTKLCYTRGRPEFVDPSDPLNKDDHACLDRAESSASAILRHVKSDAPSKQSRATGSPDFLIGQPAPTLPESTTFLRPPLSLPQFSLPLSLPTLLSHPSSPHPIIPSPLISTSPAALITRSEERFVSSMCFPAQSHLSRTSGSSPETG